MPEVGHSAFRTYSVGRVQNYKERPKILECCILYNVLFQNVATCIEGLMSRIRSLNLQLQNIDELVLQTRLQDFKVH